MVTTSSSASIECHQINNIYIYLYLNLNILTKCSLHILRSSINIKKVTSTESICQRIFKSPQMVINFTGNKCSKLILLEKLVFMQNFTKSNGLLKIVLQILKRLIWTYIFSIASEISGQNSSTIVSNFFKANTFNSGLGSSKREIIPARI